ncbi:hypothetical protein F6453_2522 [Marinobacter nauticus]|uniref:Uncharacterized protein n=1 Tax=Marinobacter nauticus TaxID=2743 RepID=A0A833JPM7_MARNT|nr:hypothetical protein F6453_2522 [Marinobacter nauticus]
MGLLPNLSSREMTCSQGSSAWLTEQGRYDTINADFHSAPVCLNQFFVSDL